MPRVAKAKGDGAGSKALNKKAAPAAKKSKLYTMPEKITEGTILTDLCKGQWRIGPSIGTGGFGEIYSACRVGEKNYDYVVKCEPHGNGPLFVEMHFYMRNAKLEDIQRFKREHNLKSLGMPYLIGNGSLDIKGQKHRFIVMPRYGSDIVRYIVANGRRLPEGTAYRIALQMLDVYEFVHSCGYVHADLKAANILLGYGAKGGAQAYLVDYGLASHYTTKEFKPDPKKMHNGTIEYTSRDAHQGVATMRADLEILAYNLIEWLGEQLPWVRDKLLTTPVKVQKAKEEFMKDVNKNLKKLFLKGVPAPIAEFFNYIAKMEYNETPQYDRIRKIFANALKTLKTPMTGDLDFKIKKAANSNLSPSTSKPKGRILAKTSPVIDSSIEEICASEDDDDDVYFEKKPARLTPLKTAKNSKTPSPTRKPAKNVKTPSPMRKPAKNVKTPSPIRKPKLLTTAKIAKAATPSPSPQKRPSTSPIQGRSPIHKKTKPTPRGDKPDSNSSNTPQTTSSRPKRFTPLSAKANINFSPAISLSCNSPNKRHGKTIINDHLTPNACAGKTYEFNFELNVSTDANVVVNVTRKKKRAEERPSSRSASNTPRANRSYTRQTDGEDADTPATRVKVHKHASGSAGNPLTPIVTICAVVCCFLLYGIMWHTSFH